MVRVFLNQYTRFPDLYTKKPNQLLNNNETDNTISLSITALRTKEKRRRQQEKSAREKQKKPATNLTSLQIPCGYFNITFFNFVIKTFYGWWLVVVIYHAFNSAAGLSYT